jgi:hypothetical protein
MTLNYDTMSGNDQCYADPTDPQVTAKQSEDNLFFPETIICSGRGCCWVTKVDQRRITNSYLATLKLSFPPVTLLTYAASRAAVAQQHRRPSH